MTEVCFADTYNLLRPLRAKSMSELRTTEADVAAVAEGLPALDPALPG